MKVSASFKYQSSFGSTLKFQSVAAQEVESLESLKSGFEGVLTQSRDRLSDWIQKNSDMGQGDYSKSEFAWHTANHVLELTERLLRVARGVRNDGELVELWSDANELLNEMESLWLKLPCRVEEGRNFVFPPEFDALAATLDFFQNEITALWHYSKTRTAFLAQRGEDAESLRAKVARLESDLSRLRQKRRNS